MSRKKAYRLVRTAFVYLYFDLAILALALVMAVRLWGQPPARLFLVFWAANFAAALWAKRKLILDLLEGRIETFRGQIDHRENAGSLRCVRVEYLAPFPRRCLRAAVRQDSAAVSAPEPFGGGSHRGGRERTLRRKADKGMV